jgi:molybdopterin-binding protein
VAINADTWTEPELRTVISKGAELLNVQFTDDFMHQLIHECFNNVYIVQETCRQVCLENRITHTSAELMSLGGGSDVRAAVKSVVAQQTGRYMSFVTQFSAGFQTTSLEMYKWLIYPVLTATAEQLEHGFSYRELRESIQSKHPSGETLNPGNLTQALQSVASLQVKKDITPIILDYDQTNLRLNIVDRGFIIWLNHQNRPDLLAAAGLPTGDNNNPGFKFS